MAQNNPSSHRLARDEDGAETVISTVLLLGIMITVSGAMLAWGIPMIQRNEALASYSATLGSFEGLEAQLEVVVAQGEGASRTAAVSSSAGVINLNGKSDMWLMIWTYVDWAELTFWEFEKDQTGFLVQDLSRPLGSPPKNWQVTVNWSENGTSATKGLVGTRVDFGVVLEPPLTGTVHAGNGTAVGGFKWFETDAVKYRYPSVGGTYSIHMANGGLVVREPGINPRVANGPMILSQDDEDGKSSYLVNLVALNSTDAPFNAVTAGNFYISMTNQGSQLYMPDPIHSLKFQFLGQGRKGWLAYFRSNEGFLASNTADEVGYTQDEPFQLSIIETEVKIRLGFR